MTERWILLKDCRFELTQRWSRLEPQLIDEEQTCLSICLERLCLPSASVEREHHEAPQALTERVGCNQLFELGDELVASTKRKLCFAAVLDCLDPQLLERGNGSLGEGLIDEVGERRATPKRERSGQGHRSRLGCRSA